MPTITHRWKLSRLTITTGKSHYKKEIPFEVPESSWEWVRIKDIFFINPKNDLDDNIDVSFIPMQLISDEFTNEHKSEIRKWKDVKRGFTHFREGDVAVAKITPCFENRKSIILNNLENHFGAGTTELHILRPILEPLLVNYTLCLIKSEYFINHGISHFSGAVGQQRVGRNILEETWFPLPPLPEQNRIVAEVKRLFGLIDIIEQSKFSLEQVIKQTKSKILDLAFRGKLVPQDSNEEPASTLLKQIKKRPHKITADKSHYPFEVPKNWLWCNFSDLYILISGRDLDKDEFNDVGFGIPYLIGASSLINNQFEVNRWTTTPKVLSEKDDLLITCKGTVGELIINDIGKVHIARQFMAIRSIVKIKTKFTKYFFEYSIETIKERAKGVIPGISRKDILEIFIPLPPLAEQKRIVSQIEKIFIELDIIENSLKA